MRIGVKILVVVSAAVVTANAGAQEARQQARGAKVVLPRSVAKAWNEYAMAVERGDAKTAAQLWTQDAKGIADGRLFEGQAAIEKFIADYFATAKVTSFQVYPAEFHRSGTTAWEMGKYTNRFQLQGKGEQTVECWYLAVWEQQGDTAWRISRIVNNCAPPT